MSMRSLLDPILDDEAVTRGLGDPEAALLVSWLAEWGELLAETSDDEGEARERIAELCRRARLVGRFVRLWGEPATRGAAVQLAAAERCGWPMPTGAVEPAELIQDLLMKENPSPARWAA